MTDIRLVSLQNFPRREAYVLPCCFTIFTFPIIIIGSKLRIIRQHNEIRVTRHYVPFMLRNAGIFARIFFTCINTVECSVTFHLGSARFEVSAVLLSVLLRNASSFLYTSLVFSILFGFIVHSTDSTIKVIESNEKLCLLFTMANMIPDLRNSKWLVQYVSGSLILLKTSK